MPTVFLTGASGFLGGHLLRELRSAGCTVRALSRRPETDAAIAGAGGVPVRGRLDDARVLATAMVGCEAVFHAAAATRLCVAGNRRRRPKRLLSRAMFCRSIRARPGASSITP